MTRPDEIRIGDAERDAVTSALHDHFAAGRLDQAELDERLDAALAAKTGGDLRAIVRDLPGQNGLPEAVLAGHPHRGHPNRGDHPYAHWHPAFQHGPPAWDRHHPAWAGRRRPGFPAFPILLGVFLIVTFTAGPATAFFAVFQLALLVWIVRAIMLAATYRRAQRR
ncbi:DUF1707 SHOCT-like domain-containing protein [Actinomadura rudentiformis]|uniref:DUF1707 SHOCT-like domain-containing protein n=1 Tax=Actinomadura rudentiformis TaxID=359158 RepID=UPI00178C56C6|nr:DUF1707 domain-containing protein [Actinomadura rudentiformis]